MAKTELDDDPESNMLDFSFWKWFVGVYNLINTYLEKYWTKGWVYGGMKANGFKRYWNKKHIEPFCIQHFGLIFSLPHVCTEEPQKSRQSYFFEISDIFERKKNCS